MQTGRLVEDPKFTTDDDDVTYRFVKVLLNNGREPTAFIHDQPGDWYPYRKGDRVRLSPNDATGDGASGWVVIGKFTDDFEPVDEKNREIHGPKDGNLVLRSRKAFDVEAVDDARVQGDNVRLGNGTSSSQSAVAIQSEVRGDLDSLFNLHALIDTALKAIQSALGNPAATAAVEAYSALLKATQMTSEGAENVTAKPDGGV